MDWINATHPSKKTKEKKHGASRNKILRNLHVRFDLNVDQKTIPPPTVWSKILARITRNQMVEEGFDLIPTTELVLRGLAKAKFKYITKIVFDEKTILHHTKDYSNLRKTINDFNTITYNIPVEKSIEVIAISKDGRRSIAIIKIMKRHKKKNHAGDLQIKGGIKKELFQAFHNYLTEKIHITDAEQ